MKFERNGEIIGVKTFFNVFFHFGHVFYVLNVFYFPNVFTARCYASAVLAMGLCLYVCLSVSVTSRSSTKTDKRRITQTTPHDSPGTLVFCAEDLREIRPGSPSTRAPNAGGVGQNRRLSTNNRLYLENGTR